MNAPCRPAVIFHFIHHITKFVIINLMSRTGGLQPREYKYIFSNNPNLREGVHRI